MNDLEKLVQALAHIKEAESLCESFKGNKDFLANTKEPFEDIKCFISDSITLNATLETKTTPIGCFRHPKANLAKLNGVQVQEIIKLVDAGEGFKKIATGYGVSEKCIRDIAQCKTWRDVPRPNGILHGRTHYKKRKTATFTASLSV